MYSLFCSQFHTEFLRWMSIHYGFTYHNCHTELLCDPLGQHHCKYHSQLYSFYNIKLRHQIQFLRVRCHQGLSMKRGKRFSHSSHSRSLSDALQYFLHKLHWNLGPEFISISPARMIRINKFVSFEGLKLRSPSGLLWFPSFLMLYLPSSEIPCCGSVRKWADSKALQQPPSHLHRSVCISVYLKWPVYTIIAIHHCSSLFKTVVVLHLQK